MDLSKQSITGPEFDLNRRGYDPDAVDGHLREIAAAVADRESQIAERETLIASLEAKVQDADESEEALRLTLKAAAHAKAELLAGAREQVKTMESEAAAKAATVVNDAEAKASELTSGAEARAAAIEEGASAQARDVAKAALAESELLVGRIESLRQQLSVAEGALSKLSVEAAPNIASSREALDNALAQARETVENPELLRPAPAAPPAPAVAPEPVEAMAAVEPEVAPASVPEAPESVAAVPTEEAVAAEAPEQAPVDESHDSGQADYAAEAQGPGPQDESVDSAGTDEQRHEPHLEVVAATESTAEISDKVDRLLEELREVT